MLSNLSTFISLLHSTRKKKEKRKRIKDKDKLKIDGTFISLWKIESCWSNRHVDVIPHWFVSHWALEKCGNLKSWQNVVRKQKQSNQYALQYQNKAISFMFEKEENQFFLVFFSFSWLIHYYLTAKYNVVLKMHG